MVSDNHCRQVWAEHWGPMKTYRCDARLGDLQYSRQVAQNKCTICCDIATTCTFYLLLVWVWGAPETRVNPRALLTLGTRAQRGLQYFSCVSVCLSVYDYSRTSVGSVESAYE